jgi:hypothetical protein
MKYGILSALITANEITQDITITQTRQDTVKEKQLFVHGIIFFGDFNINVQAGSSLKLPSTIWQCTVCLLYDSSIA